MQSAAASAYEDDAIGGISGGNEYAQTAKYESGNLGFDPNMFSLLRGTFTHDGGVPEFLDPGLSVADSYSVNWPLPGSHCLDQERREGQSRQAQSLHRFHISLSVCAAHFPDRHAYGRRPGCVLVVLLCFAPTGHSFLSCIYIYIYIHIIYIYIYIYTYIHNNDLIQS